MNDGMLGTIAFVLAMMALTISASSCNIVSAIDRGNQCMQETQ